MQVLGDRGGDFDLVRDCWRAVGGDHDGSGRSARGHAGHQKIVGADDHRAFDFAKPDLGPAQFVRPQAAAHDAHFAAGQGGAGMHGLNVGVAVDVLLAQQTVGNSHGLQLPQMHAASAYRGSRPKCSTICITARP